MPKRQPPRSSIHIIAYSVFSPQGGISNIFSPIFACFFAITPLRHEKSQNKLFLRLGRGKWRLCIPIMCYYPLATLDFEYLSSETARKIFLGEGRKFALIRRRKIANYILLAAPLAPHILPPLTVDYPCRVCYPRFELSALGADLNVSPNHLTPPSSFRIGIECMSW